MPVLIKWIGSVVQAISGQGAEVVDMNALFDILLRSWIPSY